MERTRLGDPHPSPLPRGEGTKTGARCRTSGVSLQRVCVLEDLLPGQGERGDIQVRFAFCFKTRQLYEFVPVFLANAPIQAWHAALQASNLLAGTANRIAPTPRTTLRLDLPLDHMDHQALQMTLQGTAF